MNVRVKLFNLFTFFATLLILQGCGVHRTIETSKKFDPPKENTLQLMPVNAIGKEIHTAGDGKTVVNDSFKFIHKEDMIIAENQGFKITVRHVPFMEIVEDYGVPTLISHPLKSDSYQVLHSTGPWDAPAFRSFYKSENSEPYQSAFIVPFYTPSIPDIYLTDKNKDILNAFLEDFRTGKIQPLTLAGDNRTPREVKEQMTRIIGQPYYESYVSNIIVFHITIENKSENKIRLWPRENSVLINNNNSQYAALPKEYLNGELTTWKTRVNEWNSSYKEEPTFGILLYETGPTYEKKLHVGYVIPNSPAYVAGLNKDDRILEVEGKTVDSASDLLKATQYKESGDEVNLTIENKAGNKNKIKIKLVNGNQFIKRNHVKVIEGGNIFPNVAYDGLLPFRSLEANIEGSTFKLIVPLIASDFNAADVPFKSYELQFDFKNKDIKN